MPSGRDSPIMSEAAEDDAASARGREVWIEKYRPESLADVKGHGDIIERLTSYVERNDLPHLMFAGPAGVGKCVTGDTPVVTSDGIEQIGSVVGDADGFEAPEDGLEVLTFDGDSSFEYVEPSHVFGKEAEELVRMTTRDGNESVLTPEHELLTVDEDGLEWVPAGDMDAGTRVVRPHTTPLPDGDSRLDWVGSMDGDRTFVHVSESFAEEHEIPIEQNYVGKKKRVVAGLRRGEAVTDIAAAADTTAKVVREYRRTLDRNLEATSTTCSLSFLRTLEISRDELKRHVGSIQYVARNNRRSEPITPPWELTPELARFVGLAVSEAHLRGGRVKFYNTDERLLDEFETAAETVFDADVRHGEQQGVPYRELGNRTLTHLVESCFDVFDGATDGSGIGSKLLLGDDESRRAFLQAVFDAEGHVTEQGIIELTQKNEELVTLVSYLLSGFGIPGRRKRVRKAATNGSGTKREYHTLYVSSARHLRQFEKRVGFTLETKAERLAANADKPPNPNNDTIPAQSAVDTLSEALYLTKSEYVPETLNPDSPGREAYLAALDELLDAASARLDTAQEVLERLDRLSADLTAAAGVPATWVTQREALAPIETRKDLEADIGVRADRLLEYVDGRRTPESDRAVAIMDTLDGSTEVDLDHVRTTLGDSIEQLGVSYNRVADGTAMRGTEVISLLEGGNDLESLPKFRTVADRIQSIAVEMLSEDVLGALTTLHTLVESDLYFDTVESVEVVDESRRVYDLTVPETRNYVAGDVPTVMHNTTAASAIAKELYGEDWRENFLELNASDERGIDVVRDRIKSFARSSFGGYDYRVIFLDEADALCVPPGTEVIAGYPSSPEVKPIEEVHEDGEPIPSVDFETNEIQSDKGKLVDSGVADFFELELADGRTTVASLTHPFFVVGDDGKLVEKELRELSPGDEIADFRDDVGVSRCEVCEDWTAGRFCSVSCKDKGHSRDMQGQGNPMHGTEWSEKRREKIVNKLSDGRFAGENNPNHGGDFHGVHATEMDKETIEEWKEALSEVRSGTPWEEWVVNADPEKTKTEIARSCAEWWDELNEEEKERLERKRVRNTDYPVHDITGDNNPMRDPEVARKVSEALKGHEPYWPDVDYCDELGHRVRSSWEYEVADALQDAGVEYEYEPAFELSDSTYYPDFQIDDTIVEVKGVVELWGRIEKVEEFLQRYGDEYEYVVVGDDALPHDEHYDRNEFEPALVSDGGLRRVETVEVRHIEYSHRGRAYNISMEGTPNFMLANGILTHNTSDAQGALRRTMEQFSNNTRFVLSCNYSSQIIDPIQSRCAVFRFSPLADEAVAAQVREIAETEGIEVTDDGVDALVYAADGDMRKAINGLQAAAVMGDTVDEEAVFAITSTARPEEIKEMVDLALEGDFTQARSRLDHLLTEVGIAGGDIIDQLHRSVWEFDIPDRAAVRLMDRVGEADYRITAGANEQVQLEALLASLALDDEE